MVHFQQRVLSAWTGFSTTSVSGTGIELDDDDDEDVSVVVGVVVFGTSSASSSFRSLKHFEQYPLEADDLFWISFSTTIPDHNERDSMNDE